jgi:small subunit ribosomal protein S9
MSAEQPEGAEQPQSGEQPEQAPQEQQEAPAAEQTPVAAEAPVAEEIPAAEETPVAEQAPVAEEAAAQPQASAAQEPAAGAAEQPVAESAEQPQAAEEDEEEEEEEPAPRVKPEVPGMHLEVDIVPEGVDPLGRGEQLDPYATDPYAVEEEEAEGEALEEDRPTSEPISSVAIDLAAGARYIATGKRKTAIARVILRPGTGAYVVNGRTLEEHFPRATLQRNIRQPLETVGYQERMDVVARLHGGGISAQAGALRHGVSKALLEADPNLRGELKRRGFLTRDARVKERKKAGLKKARKRPQFSKR